MPEPEAPTPGWRQLVPDRSSPYWKVDLSDMEARFGDFGSDHLGGNSTSEGPEAVGFGSTGVPDNVMLRQSSFFGTATLTRAVDLADLPPAWQRAGKEHQHRECLGRLQRPDLSVPAFSAYEIARTRIQAVLDGVVDDLPQTRPLLDDPGIFKPTCGFGGVSWPACASSGFNLLGRSLSLPPAGPDPDLLEAWEREEGGERGGGGRGTGEGVAVGDVGCRVHSAVLAPAQVALEEVETAEVFPLSHADEQPRNPASLYTCFTGRSNYAWAVVEPEIAEQLLQAQEGMAALFVLRHSWRTPDLIGRGPRCAVQACSLHQSQTAWKCEAQAYLGPSSVG